MNPHSCLFIIHVQCIARDACIPFKDATHNHSFHSRLTFHILFPMLPCVLNLLFPASSNKTKCSRQVYDGCQTFPTYLVIVANTAAAAREMILSEQRTDRSMKTSLLIRSGTKSNLYDICCTRWIAAVCAIQAGRPRHIYHASREKCKSNL